MAVSTEEANVVVLTSNPAPSSTPKQRVSILYNFFSSLLIILANLQECLTPTKTLGPNLMLVSMARAYNRVNHLRCSLVLPSWAPLRCSPQELSSGVPVLCSPQGLPSGAPLRGSTQGLHSGAPLRGSTQGLSSGALFRSSHPVLPSSAPHCFSPGVLLRVSS
jgi:hypothetical protein